MNQEYDKEMDSLLRRSARLAAVAPRGAERARVESSSHLDADELSAFAENALPASARLAAATHLADCDECRGLVVQLSSASGAAAEIEKRAALGVATSVAGAAVAPVAADTSAHAVAPVKAPWWQTLFGTLFAPRVLRYVAPVLVLGLVGVVSLIALRPWQGSAPGTVYRPQEERNAATSTTSANTETPGATGPGQAANAPADAVTMNSNNASPVPATGDASLPSAPKPEPQPTAGQPVAPIVLDGVSTADRDAASDYRGGDLAAAKKAGPAGEVARENKAAAPENVVVEAAPAPPPATTKSAGAEVVQQPKGAGVTETQRSKEAEEHVLNDRAQVEQNRAGQSRNRAQQEVQMPDGGSQRNDSRAMNNSQRGSVGGGYPSTTTRSERAPAARRAPRDDAKARDSAAEDDETARVDSTRSVAGRRFRREGNAWVDVNYKSSMSMTAVRRGTEGYRALVADIPELGRIAEQLGGEVVAVVKGRAYRIR